MAFPPTHPTPPATPGHSRVSQTGLFIAALALFLVASILALRQGPRPFPLKPDSAWEFFYYPLERNAFARLPRNQTDLKDLSIVPDTLDIWVVGRDGLILHGRDGGMVWEQSAVGSKPDGQAVSDLEAVFFSGPTHGWAVGLFGTILSTVDGGKSWQPQASGSGENFFSVWFSQDGWRGWVVGSNGTILSTLDGGKSWQPHTVGSYETFDTVGFSVDGLRGWITGREGLKRTVLITADGGKTWQPLGKDMLPWRGNVQFLDDGARGWAVDANGIIQATADGGQSWQPQATGFKDPVRSVQFLADGLRGWAIGREGAILRTEDGGKSWHLQTDTPPGVSSMRFLADGAHGWAVGERGAVLATADGGKSWHTQVSGGLEWFGGIQFLADGMRGWAVGRGGMLATVDGGKSWRLRSSQKNLYAIQFLADGLRGWALADNGTTTALLATVDGGESWQAQALGSKEYIAGIQFLADGLRGWAVGNNGSILATADGGQSWQPQASGSVEWLNSVQFLEDGLRGWVVGRTGTILSTLDGGKSWQPQASGSEAFLYGVQFLPDGLRGKAVGTGGTILSTADGGNTWQTQADGSKKILTRVQFLADGRRGWVAGNQGTILATEDGGKSWQPQASGSHSDLIGLRFSADGQRGWAVGENLTLLATNDGGKSWNPVQYRRYPAPWYWLACVLALALAGLGTRQKPQPAENTVADLLASDRPLRPGDPDALDYSSIALGVSRFLRNPRTEPPLTVAIAGEWGSGKSSLMNLIRHDVEQAGFATVWFNAWHHQKGEQLLASLFANIRAQAIPKLSSRAGLLFRLNLLARRSARHWLLALGLAGFGALTLAFLLSDASHLGQLLRLLDADGGWTVDRGKAVLESIPVLGGMVTVLVSLYRAGQGFGLDPSKLMASMAGAGKIANLDPGARFKFAGEFADVTTALAPGRLVIFIDDLDRCSKENVVEVLESINFLVSSGDCFIVLGMAREWVEICVALGFKELAEETSDGANAVEHRDHRREFARKYLQKLINIEVPLPKLAADASLRLLPMQSPDKDPRSLLEKSWQGLSAGLSSYRNAATLAGLAALGLAVGLGLNARMSNWLATATQPIATLGPTAKPNLELPLERLGLQAGNLAGIPVGLSSNGAPSSEEAGELVLRADQEALEKGIVLGKLGEAELVLKKKPMEFVGPPVPPVKAAPSDTPASLEKPDKAKDSGVSSYAPGMENAAHTDWLPLVPGVLFVGLAAWLLLRSPVKLTEDSDTFVDALVVWHPWIAAACPTPRMVKRFLNRVRYLAMRYRPLEAKPSPWPQQAWAKLTRRVPPKTPVAEAGFDERALVALSAIYEFRREWVVEKEKFGRLADGKGQQLFLDEQAAEGEGMEESIKKAYAALRHLDCSSLLDPLNDFSAEDWQKARSLRERFLDAIGDVKIA